MAASVVVLGLGTFVAAFDWNWFKPLVERYFSAGSGRVVRADDLSLGFSDNFEPEVRLRGVYVQNIDWASTPEPMAVAGEVRFQFAWSGLWQRPRRIRRLTLIDAQVNLERLADGRRNWRLRNAEDTAPGRVQILALEARRSRIRFIHRGQNLDVTMAAHPPAAPAPLVAGDPVTSQVDFKGSWNGRPFDGEALTGNLITFQHTGQWVPVRGQLRTGTTRIDIEGRVADLFKLSQVDAELRARGPSLSALNSFLGVQLPATVPYTLTAQLTKDQREFTFVKLDAELGKTDLAGELHYDASGTTPRLDATLQSRRADLADLGTLVRTRPGVAGAGAHPSAGAPPERLLSNTSLGAAGLRGLTAEVDLRVRELHVGALPPMQNLRLHATVDAGVLDVKPLQFGWAGGKVNATLGLDASGEVPAGKADVSWQKLRLEDLLPPQEEAKRVTGPLSGRFVFRGQGASAAALAQGGTGQLTLQLASGSLPNKLEAKLGLDGGKWLRSLFAGTQPVAIHCGELVAELRGGRVRSRQLVLETAQTRLVGVGTVDLRDEQFELWLDPQPKKTALLALSSVIRVRGGLALPGASQISLESSKEVELGREGCVGAAAAVGRPRAG